LIVRARRVEAELTPQQARPVVVEGEIEGLAQPAGTGGDVAQWCVVANPAPGPHRRDARDGLDRAEEHGGASALGFAHHVRADVDAVAAVHVEPSRGPEHHAISGRRAVVGVGAGVRAVADVGFDLDDASDQARAALDSTGEIAAHQLTTDP
jgi:hypothetical protein